MARALPLVATVALAVPASATAASGPSSRAVAFDRVPMQLPPSGAHAATASRDWLLGVRGTSTGRRLARAHGARPLLVPGAWSVPAGSARALAGALARRGLLRWAQADTGMRRASAFEGNGQETLWARGSVVPAGLPAPPKGASIGIVDDLVDKSVPDVAHVTQVNAAKTSVKGEHGTEVASVAAGVQNGTGVIGILPGAPLLSYGLSDDSCRDVSEGVLTLASKKARVINLSLEATDDCYLLQLAIADVSSTGSVVVASSGNEFANGNPIVYPAAYPHVVSVGAVDPDLDATYFTTSNQYVDVVAPGQSVPVALPAQFDFRDGARDGITREDGTSFSAPIAAGVVSWLLAARPELAGPQVGSILRRSARDLAEPGHDDATGFGLVDVAKALETPAGPVDRYEPNDGIGFVDGSAYDKPDPYAWRGGTRARTLKAAVDGLKDPADVYRIRIPARRSATVRLTPSAGNTDLAMYDAAAKTLQARALARSSRGAGKTDVVKLRNRRSRARTVYVAVVAPAAGTRTQDVAYTLKIARR